MLTVSLKALLEQCLADGGEKHLAGDVRDPEELFAPSVMAALASWHSGIFAFLAYHPTADLVVTKYVEEGTLADDSGTSVLCLFTRTLKRQNLSLPQELQGLLELDTTRSSASLALAELFRPKPAPPLPGVVFFGSCEEDSPVYVTLSGCSDAGAVRCQLRELFSIATGIATAKAGATVSRDKFTVNLVVALQKKRIEHWSPGVRSIRKWLLQACQAAWDYRDDIVTAVKLAGMA